MAWLGLAWLGWVWFGLVWLGLVSLAWLGLVWFGSVSLYLTGRLPRIVVRWGLTNEPRKPIGCFSLQRREGAASEAIATAFPRKMYEMKISLIQTSVKTFELTFGLLIPANRKFEMIEGRNNHIKTFSSCQIPQYYLRHVSSVANTVPDMSINVHARY